ncbi:hypothetical protein Vafri_4131, partial [Volvox africanus]
MAYTVPSKEAVMTLLILLLTPHAAVVRAQILDVVSSPPPGPAPAAKPHSVSAASASNTSNITSAANLPNISATAAPAAAATAVNVSLLDAINAANGNIGNVVDMFKASNNTRAMAQRAPSGGGDSSSSSSSNKAQPQTLAGQKVEAVAQQKQNVEQAREQKQQARENAASRVPDKISTGLNETEFAIFLADFRANFGSGKNIQELRNLYHETDVYQAKQLATRIYNTLTAAAQLGIAAIQAGPFAIIGLIVIGLGLAGAITSLIASILYAAASGISVYVAVAAAINNGCSAGAGSGEPTAGYTVDDTGTTVVDITNRLGDGGGGGGSGGGSGGADGGSGSGGGSSGG